METRVISGIRIAQALLTTDGAFLFCYGALSLFMVPGPAGEPYLSYGRVFSGVLPAVLGLASLACAVWLSFLRVPSDG